MEAIGYFRQRPGLERNEALPTLPESESGFFHYCQEQGYQPVATFIDGASDTERGYLQLCEYLRQPGRGFTTVVLPRVEDLSERPVEAVRRLVELEFLGARVATIGTDGSDPLEAAIALWKDRRGQDRLSRRAMDALKAKAMRGYGLGKTPYGYRIGAAGRLEVVAQESTVVGEIFRLYVEDGLGLRLIARRLNDAGTPTRRGSRWSVVTVRDILRNRTYTGTYARFGVRVPGNHTAIISLGLYRQAQRKRESAGGSRTATRQRVFALSGLGICGSCGGRMIGVSRKQSWSRKRDGGRTEAEYRYYRCGSRVNQSVCSYHTWRAEALELRVLDCLEETLANPPDGQPQPTRAQTRAAASTRLKALDGRLERYLNAAARGSLPLETLRNAVLPLVRDARRLEGRLRAMDSAGGLVPDPWWHEQQETLRLLKTGWNELSGEERRSRIGELLERAVVHDDRVEVVLQG